MKKTKIRNNIYILEFKNQYELASTFLRFQEHYESPKFQGKIFTLKEFKKWYTKERGKFSYYQDWSGFNIPSDVLKPFYKGKFNPLSKKEKQFLNLFRQEKTKFYIIGLYVNVPRKSELLKHEIAHALFYTVPEYKKEVLKEIRKYDTSKLKQSLLKTAGYSESVLEDETNAYILGLSDTAKLKVSKELRKQLKIIFSKYFHEK